MPRPLNFPKALRIGHGSSPIHLLHLVLLFLSNLPIIRAFTPFIHHPRPTSTSHRNARPPPDSESGNNYSHRFKLGNSIRRRRGVLLVDVENVRGKSGFATGHLDLLDRCLEWTTACGIAGRILWVVDHGDLPDAHWTGRDGGLAIVFSGNSIKADDVMANDIGKIAQWTDDDQRRGPMMLVTDDQGLIGRCRKGPVGKALEVVPPQVLLEELEELLQVETASSNAAANARVAAASKEISLATEWMLAYSKVRAIQQKHIPNQRRKALEQALNKWQDQLLATELGKEIYHHVRELTNAKKDIERQDSPSSSPLHPDLQVAVGKAWHKLQETTRNTGYRKETTGDRVVLAEQFRRDLSQRYQESTLALLREDNNGSEETWSPAQRYVRHWTCLHAPSLAQSSTGSSTLRMVVISDTHGFEQDLPPLPKGDVLLHLGDFSLEGPAKEVALKMFDHWLSKQPHPQKIVLRGNHDPIKSVHFDRSGALFVTTPRTVVVGGFSLALVPFLSRMAGKCLPVRCDAVASHVPPHGVLDECTTGKSAGCPTLKKRLQQMDEAPKLILCGHIHEGRGWVQRDFSQPQRSGANEEDSATLVLNAANANPGIAESIEYGPVVVQLTRQGRDGPVRVEFQMAEDGTGTSPLWEYYDDQNGKTTESPIIGSEGSQDVLSTSKLLLTIRLGLKTGVSLFNDSGQLLTYKQYQFSSINVMRRQAETILEDLCNEHKSSVIAHVALVGGDAELREAWVQALTTTFSAPKDLIELDTNDWRRAMLTNAELASSQAAKTATREIASKIISEYSADPFSVKLEKLPMVVAESILAGVFVANNHCRKRNGVSSHETGNLEMMNPSSPLPGPVSGEPNQGVAVK